MRDLYEKMRLRSVALKNFVGGLAWGLGATVGVAIFITLLSVLLNFLGGLPVVGDFFANLIEATQNALEAKKRGF